MSKKLFTKALAGGAAVALSLGFGAVAANAGGGWFAPSMHIELQCHIEGMPTIVATTTDMGDYHSDDPNEVWNINQVVTINGEVFRTSDKTHARQEVHYFKYPLPDPPFELGGYFEVESYIKDGQDETTSDMGSPMIENLTIEISEDCGWGDEPDPEETDEPDPVETDEPDPVETDEPDPVETDKPDPVETTESSGDQLEEIPPLGASLELTAAALVLLAAGGAAVLVARRRSYNS